MRTTPIAILGMGCRFPGKVRDPETFWQLLREGRSAITEISEDRWESHDLAETVPRKAGLLDGIDQFDAEFFHLGPRETEHMDPQHRLLLEVAWEALEHAGLPVERLQASMTSVYIGISNDDYRLLHMPQTQAIDAYSGTGTVHSFAANRISYLLDLRGPSLAVDATCASSLVAIHLACQSLAAGESDLAIAGAVNLILAPISMLATAKVVTLAADGRLKTFDASADGIVRGEGCGVVVLKRLADALANGDRICAVIEGTAVNQDGRSNGITAPNPVAQEAVIRRALAAAGVAPSDIAYVEAHGTGTPLGDPIEMEALSRVFSRLVVGSVKTNFGHLEASAGMAGLIKTVLALEKGVIPPHLNLKTLNPMVAEFAGRFEISCRLRDWPAQSPRRAGVSAFSLGGTNAHIVLSSAPVARPDAPATTGRPQLLALSAATPKALEQRVAQIAEWLIAQGPQVEWSNVCYTAGVRRSHYRHRMAVVDESSSSAARQLLHRLPHPATNREPSAGLVFVFAGQAENWSQAGRQLLMEDPAFAASLEQSSVFLMAKTGWSLIEELSGPDGLVRRDVAQAGILAQQLAMVDMLAEKGITPGAVLGHSLGEVAAACIAGILRREEALSMLLKRGELVQYIAGRGCMAALRIDAARAETLIAGQRGRVSIAAINAPASVVISGDHEAMAEVRAEAERQMLPWLPLSSEYAFHSPQIQPLLSAFTQATRKLEHRRPECPMYSTVSGTRIEAAPGPSHWIRNLAEPVLFADAVQATVRDGYRHYLEIAPRGVLSSHISGMLDGAGVTGGVATLLQGQSSEWSSILKTIGELYEWGYDVRWESLFRERRPMVVLPSYPWQRKRYWLHQEKTVERCWNASELNGASWHSSGKESLFSLAGYLGLGLKTLFKDDPWQPVQFRRFKILSPLTRTPQNGPTLKAVLSPQSEKLFSLQVASRRGEEQWEGNATGEMLRETHSETGSRSWHPEEIQCRLQQRDINLLAKTLQDKGVQCTVLPDVPRLFLASSEVFAETEMSSSHDFSDLIDTCLQVAALPCALQSGPMLALGFENAELRNSGPATRVWIHATVRREIENNWLADLEARDASGKTLVEFRGLGLRKASPGLLYHLAWQPLPDQGARQEGDRIARIAQTAQAPPGDAAVYEETRARMSFVCAHCAADVLRRLPGDGKADFQERYGPLLRALGEMARNAAPAAGHRELLFQLEREYPTLAVELDLLARCTNILPDVLTGKADPLQPLFEGNSAQRIYRESPFARYWNAMMKNAVLEAIAGCKPGSRIRILEVGAGTGSTTAALLPHLPADRVEYWFTDVSGAFLNRARREFERYPFLRYALLDLTRDPAQQGFQGSDFNIILAADALHTTGDGRLPLRMLLSLASPGAILIMLEGTSNRCWANLTFGATRGWFRPDGNDPLREPEYWAAAARAEGWEKSAVIARGPGELTAIIAAEAPHKAARDLWIVLGGSNNAAASQMTAMLRARHQEVITAGKLEEELIAHAAEPAGVLDCRYTSTEGAPIEELCGMAVETVWALAKRTWRIPPKLWLMTRNAMAPTNADEVAQSAIHGLGRTLFTEHREFGGGLIDLENFADGVAPVWEIIQRRSSDDWYSIRGGRILAARVRRSSPREEAPAPSFSAGTYLITGGFGGIGLHLAGWMAEHGARRIALVSRHLPTDADQRLRSLKDRGVELLVKTADVADLDQMACVLEQIEDSRKPLRGVVHAAGIARDSIIANLNAQDLKDVLRPKITGAWNLHILTRDLPLDFFMLCSSASTWIGLSGLAAYAAANAYLDGLAAYRNECGLPAQVVDWGGWRDTGMAQRVGEQRQHQWSSRGLGLMHPQDALAAWQQAFRSSQVRTGIISVDWEEFLSGYPGGTIPGIYQDVAPGAVKDAPRGQAASLPSMPDLRRRLQHATLSERPAMFYEFLRDQLSRLVATALPDRLSPERSVVELGMDSLMAVEVRNALAGALGIHLPVTVVFDYPTPRALLEFTLGVSGLELPVSGEPAIHLDAIPWPPPIRL